MMFPSSPAIKWDGKGIKNGILFIKFFAVFKERGEGARCPSSSSFGSIFANRPSPFQSCKRSGGGVPVHLSIVVGAACARLWIGTSGSLSDKKNGVLYASDISSPFLMHVFCSHLVKAIYNDNSNPIIPFF